jgi:quercetin dioxygenase-like cupin family protein
MYPRTITNGGGERFTFVRRVTGPDGDRLEVEGVATPGAGPPMHVHHLQEEVIVVVSGRVGFQVPGQEPQYATAGETKVFGPGVAHKWWNAGDVELHMTGWVKPPLNLEYFLSELFAATARNGGARPGLFDIAFLATRYRTEFTMVEIPIAVQRVVFPIVLALGFLLGKYGRFRDAPAPVHG